jgi:hypothetical protein
MQQQQAPNMNRLSPLAFFLARSCAPSSSSPEKARPSDPTMYPSDLVADPYETGVRDDGLLNAMLGSSGRGRQNLVPRKQGKIFFLFLSRPSIFATVTLPRTYFTR